MRGTLVVARVDYYSGFQLFLVPVCVCLSRGRCNLLASQVAASRVGTMRCKTFFIIYIYFLSFKLTKRRKQHSCGGCTPPVPFPVPRSPFLPPSPPPPRADPFSPENIHARTQRSAAPTHALPPFLSFPSFHRGCGSPLLQQKYLNLTLTLTHHTPTSSSSSSSLQLQLHITSGFLLVPSRTWSINP